jgi:transposase
MGLTTRILLVDDDDSLHRLPLARFERLRRGDPEESIPKYAGKRVRYVLVVLDLIDRRPVEILHVEYSWLSFNSEGRLDQAERERKAKLAMDLLPAMSTNGAEQTVDARHRFARKRYQSEYSWEPTPEVQATIMAAVFGKVS